MRGLSKIRLNVINGIPVHQPFVMRYYNSRHPTVESKVYIIVEKSDIPDSDIEPFQIDVRSNSTSDEKYYQELDRIFNYDDILNTGVTEKSNITCGGIDGIKEVRIEENHFEGMEVSVTQNESTYNSGLRLEDSGDNFLENTSNRCNDIRENSGENYGSDDTDFKLGKSNGMFESKENLELQFEVNKELHNEKNELSNVCDKSRMISENGVDFNLLSNIKEENEQQDYCFVTRSKSSYAVSNINDGPEEIYETYFLETNSDERNQDQSITKDNIFMAEKRSNEMYNINNFCEQICENFTMETNRNEKNHQKDSTMIYQENIDLNRRNELKQLTCTNETDKAMRPYECNYNNIQDNAKIKRKKLVPCIFGNKLPLRTGIKNHTQTLFRQQLMDAYNRRLSVRLCRITNLDIKKKNKHRSQLHRPRSKVIRRYKCDRCEYSFDRPSQLERHKSRHTGHKPLKCDQCPYSTAWKQSLKEHMEAHLREVRGVACKICKVKFKTGRARQVHMKKEHSD